MRRRSLLVFASFWFSNASAGGVSLGSNLPSKLVATQAAAQRFVLVGKVKAIRWVNQTGRVVQQSVSVDLGPTLRLDAPTGEWTDLVLVFDGPVAVTDGEHSRALDSRSFELALAEPLATTGGELLVTLDLSAPDGLFSGSGALAADSALALALADGAIAVVALD